VKKCCAAQPPHSYAFTATKEIGGGQAKALTCRTALEPCMHPIRNIRYNMYVCLYTLPRVFMAATSHARRRHERAQAAGRPLLALRPTSRPRLPRQRYPMRGNYSHPSHVSHSSVILAIEIGRGAFLWVIGVRLGKHLSCVTHICARKQKQPFLQSTDMKTPAPWQRFRDSENPKRCYTVLQSARFHYYCPQQPANAAPAASSHCHSPVQRCKEDGIGHPNLVLVMFSFLVIPGR
jgi:hypothetical protein